MRILPTCHHMPPYEAARVANQGSHEHFLPNPRGRLPSRSNSVESGTDTEPKTGMKLYACLKHLLLP